MVRNVFALLLMAVLAVGCTDPIEEIVPDGPVTLTASVSFSDATKALSEAGAKTFAVGDRIAVIYYNTSGQTVKAVSEALTNNGTDIQNAGKFAKFTVTLSSPKPDGSVRYIYPAEMAMEPLATNVSTNDDDKTVNYDALAIQDGTLEYVSKHLDLCTFDGNFSGGTLPTNVSLTNRLALCKIGFKFGDDPIAAPFDTRTVDDGINTYTVNTVNGGNTNYMWVAIRPVNGDQTLEFCATKGDAPYYRKVTGEALAAGYFYDLTIKMKKLDGILLAGKFTVNMQGGRVYFSKGNLQFKGGQEGSEYPGYYFAKNQLEYIGNAAGNTTETDRRHQTARIDLFGWGTGGMVGEFTASELAVCYSPWDNSTNSADYYAYANRQNHLYEGGKYEYKADWGYWDVFNGGGRERKFWRTLKNFTNENYDNEWEFIFNSRKTGKTVNNVKDARYTMATINTDNGTVNGLILFPDNYAGPTADATGITWGAINKASDWGTRCTPAGWTTLEAAGCVFLPAAGYRLGVTVNNAGSYGYYWSSSCNRTEDNAYCVTFGSNGTSYVANGRSCNPRAEGYCVRLVKDVSSLDGTLEP